MADGCGGYVYRDPSEQIDQEEIDIPYGRGQRESASTAIDTAESEQMSLLGGYIRCAG
jgi:hypothetical protein